MPILDSVLGAIGRTPLVRLSRLCPGPAALLAKLEARNPGGSVKDRVGLALIERAEREGRLAPGTLLIEPTSGNTGIGLALAAAVKGYRLILTMPETMSLERRKLLAAYGAQLVLTPGAKGMQGAIDEAQRLHAANPGSLIPQQFENPANPAAHEASTGPEILQDLGRAPDVFVAGVGTGGTLTGVGRALRRADPAVELVAVEPDTSAVLSGRPAGPHKLQGIGAGFIPKTLDRALISRVLPVSADLRRRGPPRRPHPGPGSRLRRQDHRRPLPRRRRPLPLHLALGRSLTHAPLGRLGPLGQLRQLGRLGGASPVALQGCSPFPLCVRCALCDFQNPSRPACASTPSICSNSAKSAVPFAASLRCAR